MRGLVREVRGWFSLLQEAKATLFAELRVLFVRVPQVVPFSLFFFFVSDCFFCVSLVRVLFVRVPQVVPLSLFFFLVVYFNRFFDSLVATTGCPFQSVFFWSQSVFFVSFSRQSPQIYILCVCVCVCVCVCTYVLPSVEPKV
jgi:hypothetical protein